MNLRITQSNIFSISMMVIFLLTSCQSKNIAESGTKIHQHNDYMQAGQVLANPDGKESWKIGRRFIVSQIIKPAHSKTKGQYQVSLEYGTADWKKGEKKWTKLVISKSHPAQKNELKKGALVLVNTSTPDMNEMPLGKWRLVRVNSLNQVHKKKVQVLTLNTFDGGLMKKTYDLKYMRIIDKPVNIAQKIKK